jgi:septum formation protein
LPDTLLLASKSPRRRELIKLLGVPYKLVDPADIDEEDFICNSGRLACDLPLALSRKKAEIVIERIDKGYLVCADTDVIHNNVTLGKPVDKKDACRMLKELSGDWHEVITGITVVFAENRTFNSEASVTRVKFAELTDEEISRYVESGEPMDKAGAYGIQGGAAPFIERIEGCYFNVVGLPVNLLYSMLTRTGFRFK